MHLKLSTIVELHDEKQVSDMSVYYMLILAVHILFSSKTEKKNPKKKTTNNHTGNLFYCLSIPKRHHQLIDIFKIL